MTAVEWGSGRRQGWLSNLHLAARDPATGELVMLGKTFKGLTDELLAWQTQHFLALESARDSYTVYVRPTTVVEIACDGLQVSRRYPGGVALRFARVLRYREDKTAEEADTIDTVRPAGPGDGVPRSSSEGRATIRRLTTSTAGRIELMASETAGRAAPGGTTRRAQHAADQQRVEQHRGRGRHVVDLREDQVARGIPGRGQSGQAFDPHPEQPLRGPGVCWALG